jgi:predicted methyltransferase
MKHLILACAAALALAACSTTATSSGPSQSEAIAAAIADPGRPEADTTRDVNRKPAEMLKFADIGPGSKVADLIPGGGYFTRIFSKAVGPTGTVYALVGPPRPAAAPAPGAAPAAPPALRGPALMATQSGYENMKIIDQPYAELKLPEPVDVIWTSQNYHDVHLRPGVDMAAFNKAMFDNLKPGGIYIVLDHAAAPGSGAAGMALHRIDPAIVKEEVEAVGFKFAGESKVLRNPNDVHTNRVMDSDIRGVTDQFIYKFKKPN